VVQFASAFCVFITLAEFTDRRGLEPFVFGFYSKENRLSSPNGDPGARKEEETPMTIKKKPDEDNLTSDMEIKQTVLNYIEAWYRCEPERGKSSLHPELAKRIVKIDPDTGKDRLEMMSASTLYERWQSGDGKKTPKALQLKDVTILDRYGDMASVKLETGAWVDYMHLARFNHEWVIINILWELK